MSKLVDDEGSRFYWYMLLVQYGVEVYANKLDRTNTAKICSYAVPRLLENSAPSPGDFFLKFSAMIEHKIQVRFQSW